MNLSSELHICICIFICKLRHMKLSLKILFFFKCRYVQKVTKLVRGQFTESSK